MVLVEGLGPGKNWVYYRQDESDCFPPDVDGEEVRPISRNGRTLQVRED